MWSNGFSPPSLSNTHALLCILKFRESKKQKLLTTFVVVAANPCFLLLPKLQGSSFYYVHNWNYEWKSFKILTLLAPKNWPVPTTKKIRVYLCVDKVTLNLTVAFSRWPLANIQYTVKGGWNGEGKLSRQLFKLHAIKKV